MFEKIMDILCAHCVQGNLDFNRSYFNYRRKGLINRLKKIHGMSKFKAKMVGVMGNDGTTVGLVVFDTMEVIMNML
jgi:hypothetical protein